MQLDDFESPKNLAATSMYLEKSSNKVANWIKDSVKIQGGLSEFPDLPTALLCMGQKYQTQCKKIK